MQICEIAVPALVLGCALAISAASLVAGAANAAEAVPSQPWIAEHDEAIRLARRGDTSAALTILKRLRREQPEDIGLARDVIVVSAWAKREAEAIQLFLALPPGPQPDYVIEAVALAYSHLQRPIEALELYRQGLRQSPDNVAFKAREIRSLVNLSRFEEAIALADDDLRARGERADVLLAAGYAARGQKNPVEALRYIDRVLKADPARSEAIHDRIMAIAEMGAPEVARRLADENPGVMSDAELRQIDGDAAAALVRWGVLEPPSEELRFAASDRAIAALDILIARWTKEGDAARRDVLRARFDRMVAFRDRVRMANVLTEYDDLRGQNVAIPGYALVAVADAYLYSRQPETARDLYLHALEVDPRNPLTRMALFYAYVDLGDFDAAYRHAAAMAADEPIWLYLKGLNDPVENPDRAGAALAAATARLYADELAEANRRVAALAEAAPNNTQYRSALANVYSARGWPRLAAEEFEISRALMPRNVTTEAGQALNDLDLRDYRMAEAQRADLKRRFPENLEVQRLDRLWRVHNMAEFRLDVGAAQRSATNVQGGSGLAIDTQLYSPPLAYNWRIFGSAYVAHELLPEGEGAITLRRSAVGAEFSGRDLIASLEATISAHGPDLGDTLTSSVGRGRGGARAQASWSVDDYWQVGGGAEIFARDTPLRAMRHGVTANAASASVAYRESESREFRMGGVAMDFSDGNVRTSLAGQFSQRLMTRPHFSIDGILGLAESQNSADNNRPYFNPRQDVLATAGASINHTLYRRYEFTYAHQLVVTPGYYWEQDFSDGGVVSVMYEHRLRADDVLEAGLGVNFGRQLYDGQYEGSLGAVFNLRLRF